MQLVQDMLLYQRDQAERNGAAAEGRLADAREELLTAEAELAKAQAEGPASHRKRDYIDKVCKGTADHPRLEIFIQAVDLRNLMQALATFMTHVDSDYTYVYWQDMQ